MHHATKKGLWSENLGLIQGKHKRPNSGEPVDHDQRRHKYFMTNSALMSAGVGEQNEHKLSVTDYALTKKLNRNVIYGFGESPAKQK